MEKLKNHLHFVGEKSWAAKLCVQYYEQVEIVR